MIIIVREHDNFIIWSTLMIILLWLCNEYVEHDDNHILRTWWSCHMTNIDDEIIMSEFFAWISWRWWLSMCLIGLTNVELIYAHFIWDLFEIKSLDGKLSYRARKIPWWEIILQNKKDSLIKNYLAEREKYEFHFLKSNPLM
jgi:hypothetical protein